MLIYALSVVARDVVMTIINSNSWREALMNEDIHMKTGLRVTPMRRLIRKMPGKYYIKRMMKVMSLYINIIVVFQAISLLD